MCRRRINGMDRASANDQALEVLKKMAAYFYRRITHVIAANGTQVWEQVLGTEAGGMNDVMYKLFRITRDPDHLTMAHRAQP